MITRTPDDQYRQALERLAKQAKRASQLSIADLFASEAQRLQEFSVDAAGLHLDLSKQRIRSEDLAALIALAQACGFKPQRDAQLRGEHVNFTEERAALHTALRGSPLRELRPDSQDLMPAIEQTLARMRELCRQIRDGRRAGSDKRRITDVVNVGIGGSQLGPLLACQALREYAHDGPAIHFLGNVDPGAWDALRPRLNPRTTLVIIASKSWKTVETIRNSEAVCQWLMDAGIKGSELSFHLVGITARPDRARATGLVDETIFPFWEWVGGRFSLWSAIGLPVMLAIGPEAFDQLLQGARDMDEHFASAPLEKNAPLLLALTTVWNQLALPGSSEAIVPYCDALSRFPAYLQQLQMESNGKSVDLNGSPVITSTIPVIWGEPGTDAQHAFFQALHQGTAMQSVEFIIVIPTKPDAQRRDYSLVANAIAQAEALMRGRDLSESLEKLLDSGTNEIQAKKTAPHLVLPGNRPSTTIVLGKLTPHSLGALLALYEHKTAALGWLWRINSYDQWGVDLGKELAQRIEASLLDETAAEQNLDPSTAALLRRVRKLLASR